MTIRKANINDLDDLAILFDGYRVFYEKASDMAAAKFFLKERLDNMDAALFVAEDVSKQLVAFTQLYPLFSSTRMRKLWLLNDLFVDPAFRGKGISVALIEKAKELCRDTNACGMLLETAKSNTIGNNLYPKTGFELNATSNFYEWTNA
ncbi:MULTISPECIES: GNAT family N-acetyltransferase [Chitinophagaceae]